MRTKIRFSQKSFVKQIVCNYPTCVLKYYVNDKISVFKIFLRFRLTSINFIDIILIDKKKGATAMTTKDLHKLRNKILLEKRKKQLTFNKINDKIIIENKKGVEDNEPIQSNSIRKRA